jgi:hypothetical protein
LLVTNLRKLCFLVTLIAVTALLLLVTPVAASTVSLKITKYYSDGVTVMQQKIVTYTWMRDNLPVLGDGTTHYYHQGPVFVDNSNADTQAELRWNPREDTNVKDKDMGALKGTNLKDLCDLVGGMQERDELKVKAEDGLAKRFAYKNIYNYSSREGPMVLAWSKDGLYPDSGYSEGMRLVWFADNTINPFGLHVFGNNDWRLAAASQYYYFYQSGTEKYPTTTGLSVQKVSELSIYSSIASSRTPFWDLNKDHICDIGDLILIENQWLQRGKEGWISEDMNEDGLIDILDLVILGLHWRETW